MALPMTILTCLCQLLHDGDGGTSLGKMESSTYAMQRIKHAKAGRENACRRRMRSRYFKNESQRITKPESIREHHLQLIVRKVGLLLSSS